MIDDVHSRRLASDYAAAWSQLLPTGPAWPREPQTVLQQTLLGLCGIWGAPDPAAPSTGAVSSFNVDGRAADLLEIESDPRTTIEMLDSWETCFGLPDLCLAEPLTIGNRQKALTARVTMLGGQSRAWFLAYAASINYTIQIIEHGAVMCGISQVGDTRNWNSEGSAGFRWELGGPLMRFVWTIAPLDVRLTWFRCGGGGGECGVDPMLLIAQASDLECAMRRYKPAHVALAFSYAGLNPLNPLSGTP